MFDICLMNPPYDKNLHLKFLEKVICVAEKTVSVQPVRWLQDPLVNYKKSTDYKKYENSIAKHIKDIELFDSDTATKYFSADFISSVGIYVCDDKNYEIYQKYKYYKNNENFEFIDDIIKTISKEDNFNKMDVVKFTKDLHNFIPLNKMTGENLQRCKPTNAIKEWTKPYISADEYIYDKSHKSGVARGKIENDLCVVFNTLEEAKNCFDSFTKSKFTRFYMSIITTDIHVNQNYMPWMKDYKEPWTDERFYKYFNISKENQKKIENYANELIERKKM